MRWYEMIYGVLAEPAATFRQMTEKKYVQGGLVLLMLLFLFSVTVDAGLARQLTNQSALWREWSRLPGSNNYYLFYILIGLPAYLACWFLSASVYGMIGSLITGKNNPQGLLASLAFAALPSFLLPVFHVITDAFQWRMLGIGLPMAVVLWLCVLQVMAIRESLQIENDRAIIIWIAPFIVIALLFLLLVIGLVGMAGSMAA